jgi:hypothetical protein
LAVDLDSANLTRACNDIRANSRQGGLAYATLTIDDHVLSRFHKSFTYGHELLGATSEEIPPLDRGRRAERTPNLRFSLKEVVDFTIVIL